MIKLSDFQINYPKVTKNMNISFPMSEVMNEELDFDIFLPSKGMNLQRPHVWTIEQKRELIISMLKGLPINTLTVVRSCFTPASGDKKTTIKVIDGKQRLNTIKSFLNNEFGLIKDGVEYFYNDFTNDIKYYILMFDLRVNVFYEYIYEAKEKKKYNAIVSDDDLINLFSFVNFKGTPQDVEHYEKLIANKK